MRAQRSRLTTTRLTGTVCLLSVFTLVVSVVTAPQRSHAASEEEIADSIDAGMAYLKAQVRGSQTDAYHQGQVALETYALLVAGVSVNDPLIKKNFAYLHSSVPGKQPVYTLSCYIFALDAAISQIEQDILMLAPAKIRKRFRDDPRIGKEYRGYLDKAVNNLARLQNPAGGFHYGAANGNNFDNSNTQFAVLALGAGAKRSVAIDKEVWLKIMDLYVKGQMKSGAKTEDRITLRKPSDKEEWNDRVKLISGDKKKEKEKKSSGKKSGRKSKGKTVVVEPENPETGLEGIEVFRRGWDYQNKGGATWNMTCAGLSSLILVRENIAKRLTPDQKNALNKSIRDGYGWLMGSWNPVNSFYGMYSLEKVGDLGSVKLFNDKDWYEDLSSHLVGAQAGDGSWAGGNAHGEKGHPRVATSFALLILNRASSLITKTPQSRIIVSGKGGNKDPNDRSWVYVPVIKTSVHYPSLMRQIRLRPSAKLIKFLESIVKAYPPEWKGELIPEMAKIRDSIRSKSARSMIEKYLVNITGSEYKEWESYLKWHRRWERVRLIGEKKSKKNIPDLIKYYKSTSKSVSLKQTIMWALVQCNAREAIPLFLEDLESSEPAIRTSAYNNFKSFFIGFPPTFTAEGSSSVRSKQIEKIKQWHKDQVAKANRRR